MGMEIIRIVLEFDGKVTVNNDLVLEESPAAIDWFRDCDLVISGKAMTQADMLEINPHHFILDLKKSSSPQTLKVTHASTHFIFPRRFVVEVGHGESTSFFTIFAKESDKFAVDLEAPVTEPKVTLENSQITLRDKNVLFRYDPLTNKVLEHKVFLSEESPLPFRFLQHIRNGEFERARELLNFSPSDEQLKGYFGKFDVLLNNYLEDESIVSIVQGGKVKNLRFEIVDGKIDNIL